MSIFDLFKKKVVVVTHNGSFHADDVFAVATLSIWAEKNNLNLKVIRSRDPEVVKGADIALDVGMEYDPGRNRFDHHQQSGAGEHYNGIPNASFGLIWKHFGEKITSKEVARVIEDKLVMQVDARDNGMYISKSETNNFKLAEYKLGNVVAAFRPMNGTEREFYERFIHAVSFAKEILESEIEFSEAEIKGEKEILEAFEKQGEPEILVLEKIIEWERALAKVDRVKFLVSPDHNNTNWKIESPRSNVDDYDSNRAWFPQNWLGLRDSELQEKSGIKDLVFCHRKGFFGVSKTKEAGILMARRALELSRI